MPALVIDRTGPGQQEIRDALARASRDLPMGLPGAHVFFEVRHDLRATFRSSGDREVVATRSRGFAAVAGGRVHCTDPDPDTIPSLAAAAMRGGPPPAGLSQPSARDRSLDLRVESELLEWVDVIGAWVDRNRAFLGPRVGPLHWNVQLVAFNQNIWVGLAPGSVVGDLRRGARLSIRLGLEDLPCGVAEDLVLGTAASAPDESVFERMLEKVEALRGGVPASAPPGETAAVFAPGAAGVVAHELFGHAAEADAVRRGDSWLASVAHGAIPSDLSIVDDPSRGRGAWTVDDEGSPARAVEIVRDGRFVSWLHDRVSAAASGVEPTGHGRRATYLDGVQPRMGCTFVSAGQDDPEDILRGTRKGILIRRIAAGQVNPRSGRGRFVVTEADRIEGGRRGGPLRPFVVEIDAPSCVRHLDRIGHDLVFDSCVGSCVRDGQPLAVSVGAPTIRLGVITVVS